MFPGSDEIERTLAASFVRSFLKTSIQREAFEWRKRTENSARIFPIIVIVRGTHPNQCRRQPWSHGNRRNLSASKLSLGWADEIVSSRVVVASSTTIGREKRKLSSARQKTDLSRQMMTLCWMDDLAARGFTYAIHSFTDSREDTTLAPDMVVMVVFRWSAIYFAARWMSFGSFWHTWWWVLWNTHTQSVPVGSGITYTPIWRRTNFTPGTTKLQTTTTRPCFGCSLVFLLFLIFIFTIRTYRSIRFGHTETPDGHLIHTSNYDRKVCPLTPKTGSSGDSFCSFSVPSGTDEKKNRRPRGARSKCQKV